MKKSASIYMLLAGWLLFAPSVFAKSKVSIPLDNFDSTYQDIQREFDELQNSLPPSLIKAKNNRDKKNPPRLNRDTASKRKRYFELKDLKATYDPVYDLREKLVEMYFTKGGDGADRNAVTAEATRIAIGTMEEVVRLKKKNKMFFIPIFHNMMIDVGIKKRGACKHWAEDLLKYYRNVKRDYFYVTWGEAHPGTFLEHNVAVLYPRHGVFDDGMMVDPWRTGGRAWWKKVTEDPHYDWKQWDGYGIY